MLSMLSLSKFENNYASANEQTFNMLHQLGVATIVRMVPKGQKIEFESVQIRAIRCVTYLRITVQIDAIRCVTICEYARTSTKAQKT